MRRETAEATSLKAVSIDQLVAELYRRGWSPFDLAREQGRREVVEAIIAMIAAMTEQVCTADRVRRPLTAREVADAIAAADWRAYLENTGLDESAEN